MVRIKKIEDFFSYFFYPDHPTILLSQNVPLPVPLPDFSYPLFSKRFFRAWTRAWREAKGNDQDKKESAGLSDPSGRKTQDCCHQFACSSSSVMSPDRWEKDSIRNLSGLIFCSKVQKEIARL